MNLRGYLKLAQAPFLRMLAYRTGSLFWCVQIVLRIYLMKILWTAVYGGGGAVEGVTLPMMITYATLASVLALLTRSDVPWWLERKLRDGSIVVDLIRPYGFLRYLLVSSLGETILWRGPIAVIVLIGSLLFIDLQPPADALGYAVSLILAVGVGFLLSTIIGLVAFWTLQLYGFRMIFSFLSDFLAGGLIPLWLLPSWLAQIARYLPFQCLANLPLSIYIGRIEGAEAWIALGVQAVWIAVLSLVVWLMWKAAERKVIVQGG